MGSKNAHRCAQNAENCFDFDFLEQYHKYGNEFLNNIIQVTGDEIWLSFLNAETKEQFKQWMMHTNSPNKPKKFKQTSARKLMVTVSWDRKGVVVVVEFIQGNTIISEVYCETLKKLRRAIQNYRCGMLTSGAVLLHDNMRPHTAACT
jgi:tRNA(Ile2) C34 agmatinyltransferase TiaS